MIWNGLVYIDFIHEADNPPLRNTKRNRAEHVEAFTNNVYSALQQYFAPDVPGSPDTSELRRTTYRAVEEKIEFTKKKRYRLDVFVKLEAPSRPEIRRDFKVVLLPKMAKPTRVLHMAKKKNEFDLAMDDFERRVAFEQAERHKRILAENFAPSNLFVGAHVCQKCFALVDDANVVKHFDWHDEQDTDYRALKRDVERIERHVDMPPSW